MSGPLDVIGGTSAGGVFSGPTAPVSPGSGTLWYNTTTGSLNLWDGTTWIALSGGVGGATVSNAAPASPTNGMLWYDPSLSKMQVYYNGVWIATGGSGSAGAAVTVGATAPTPPTSGALWYDTTNKVLKVYDGSNWNIPSGVIVRGVTAGADKGSVEATFNFDAITVFSNEILIYTYLGTAYIYTGLPGAPVTAATAANFTALSATVNVNTQAVALGSQADIGLAWTALVTKPIVTGAVVTLATYNGDTYILLNEAAPQLAASWMKASSAGGAVVAAVAPTSPTAGALWYDTAATALKVWNGTAWALAERGAVVVQGAAPATPFTGQFFLNSAVNPHILQVWDGGAWLTVDNQPAVAAAAPAIKGTGNIWLDTGVVPNVLKIWDGSAWVTPSPVIHIGAVAPTLPVAGTFWLDTSVAAAPVLKLRNGTTWLTISGDVVGPATSTDNALARFDGATGKLIQNSVAVLDDTGDLSGIVNLTTTGNTTLGNAATDTVTLTGHVAGRAAHNVSVSTGVMDLNVAQMFTATVSATRTWSFANVPAALGCTVVLELTNGGSATQTWPASVKWPGGTAPTLTAAGTDILVFVTDDGGTIWRGNVFGKDLK